MGSRGKADSLSRFEHPGQRLDFVQGHDHSDSLRTAIALRTGATNSL